MVDGCCTCLASCGSYGEVRLFWNWNFRFEGEGEEEQVVRIEAPPLEDATILVVAVDCATRTPPLAGIDRETCPRTLENV